MPSPVRARRPHDSRRDGGATLITPVPHASQPAIYIEIGGMAIALRTQDSVFRQLLENRYAGFINSSANPQFQFDIDLFEPSETSQADDDVQVKLQDSEWFLQRGDFRARWNAELGRGHIQQSRNPYAIDSVLRIVHTLLLAKQGGFLVHAASAIRGGRAYLFAGVSGAGKTTISRLAPPDAICSATKFPTCGAKATTTALVAPPSLVSWPELGENRSARLSTLFLLEKGTENRIEEVSTGRSNPVAIEKYSLFR